MHKVEFKVYKRERVPYAPHNCMILGVKMERVASLLYLFHFIEKEKNIQKGFITKEFQNALKRSQYQKRFTAVGHFLLFTC